LSSLKDGALTGAKMLTTTTAQCAVHVSLWAYKEPRRSAEKYV
jgi:hypothetical protein